MREYQIEENINKGQYLQDIVNDRLEKYMREDETLTITTSLIRRNSEGHFQGDIDHLIGYRGVIHVVEDKNWPSERSIMTEVKFVSEVFERFIRIQNNLGLREKDYVRVAILCLTHSLAEEVKALFKGANICVILSPALTMDKEQDKEILDFIEDALLEIIEYNGRKRKDWLYEMKREDILNQSLAIVSYNV